MYIRKELEENIKKGTNNDYFTAEGLAESFEKFIDDTITELSDFSAEALQRKGIRLEKDFSSITVDYEPTDGVRFHIMKSANNYFTSYDISQHGETKSMKTIRLFSGIVGMNGVMNYRSKIFPVEAGYPDREFRFDGEEKTDGSVVNYVDGFLSSPAKAVVYHPENQQYYSIRHWQEYPKAQCQQQGKGKYKVVGYVNQDGSKAESKPFIASTYPSIDEGKADMYFKLEAFKEAFRKVLTELNEATAEKAPQIAKTENH